MRKSLILLVIILLLAISVKPGDLTTITGLFLQAGSFVLTIARYVVKQVLSLVIKVL